MSAIFECYRCGNTEFAEVRPFDWRCTGCNSSKMQMRIVQQMVEDGIPPEDAEELVEFAAERGRQMRESRA